jgi:proteasome lid subunit RPN8/RPN11
MSDIDVRWLEREQLPDGVFPGGRNEAFRVHFSPEVHAALWKHAGEDTSVEICGVLVGTWHRDECGPFATIVEAIRGEGATTKFAEVTFTHQTWAKINSEMDTRFADKKIVGWYHTHPDFGIFLSDRDRFIQEHFFSGPGQVAHVIDPVRKVEGVFVWQAGKPALADHFWVGDRVITAAAAESSAAGPASSPGTVASGGHDGLHPSSGRLMMYGAAFLVGYMLSMIVAAWDRQGFIEAEVRSNAVFSVLRLGMGGELQRLQDELSAAGSALDVVHSGSRQADRAFEDLRSRLTVASQRAAAIREYYANSPGDERVLQDVLDRARREMAARLEPRRTADSPEKKPEPEKAEPGKAEPPPPPSPTSGGEPKKP